MSIFLYHALSHFPRRPLSDLEEELTILARLAGQQAPRICLSGLTPHLSAGVTDVCHCAGILHGTEDPKSGLHAPEYVSLLPGHITFLDSTGHFLSEFPVVMFSSGKT